MTLHVQDLVLDVVPVQNLGYTCTAIWKHTDRIIYTLCLNNYNPSHIQITLNKSLPIVITIKGNHIFFT